MSACATTAASSTTCSHCAWWMSSRSATLPSRDSISPSNVARASSSTARYAMPASWGSGASASSSAAQPGLEAQIANLADEIAYNNHDVDDGIRAQLLDIAALREVRMFRRQYEAVVTLYPELNERRLVHEVIRRMVKYLVVDFIRTTQAQLAQAQPRSIDDVRAHSKPLAMLSDECREEHLELK